MTDKSEKDNKPKSGAGKFLLGALLGGIAGAIAGKFIKIGPDDGGEEIEEKSQKKCDCSEKCDCKKKAEKTTKESSEK